MQSSFLRLPSSLSLLASFKTPFSFIDMPQVSPQSGHSHIQNNQSKTQTQENHKTPFTSHLVHFGYHNYRIICFKDDHSWNCEEAIKPSFRWVNFPPSNQFIKGTQVAQSSQCLLLKTADLPELPFTHK